MIKVRAHLDRAAELLSYGADAPGSVEACGEEEINAVARKVGGEGQLRKSKKMWVKCYTSRATAVSSINNYLRVVALLSRAGVRRRYLPSKMMIKKGFCGLGAHTSIKVDTCHNWHHVTYCKGGDLTGYSYSQLRDHRNLKTLGSRAKMVCGLAHCLWHWHRAGVYHMDIASSNVLVCGQRLVPTDFGVMAFDEEIEEHPDAPMGMIEGKEGYGAPERSQSFRIKMQEAGAELGRRDIITGAPIWALGLLLSELFDLRIDPFSVGKSSRETVGEGGKEIKQGNAQEKDVKTILFVQNRVLRESIAKHGWGTCFARLQENAFKQMNMPARGQRREQRRVRAILGEGEQEKYRIHELMDACLTLHPGERMRNFRAYIDNTRHLQ